MMMNWKKIREFGKGALLMLLVLFLVGISFSLSNTKHSNQEDIKFVEAAGNGRTFYKYDGTTKLGTFLLYSGLVSDCDTIVYADTNGDILTIASKHCNTDRSRTWYYSSANCPGTGMTPYCGTCTYITNYNQRGTYGGYLGRPDYNSYRTTDGSCTNVFGTSVELYSMSSVVTRTCGAGECKVK